MGYIVRLYRAANLLSLDVAIGAVCCSLFFMRIFGEEIQIAALASLFITVWIIYSLDHLRDAHFTCSPSTERHRFHKTHFKKIIIGVVFALVSNFSLLWFIPQAIIVHGLVTMFLVGLYLLLQRRLHPFKEFFVAIFYLTGVLTPCTNLMNGINQNYLLLLSFSLVAFLNLILFSWFDFRNDVRDTHSSIAIFLGKSKVVWIFGLLFLALTLITLMNVQRDAFVIIWAMGFLHALIFIFHGYFSCGERFRIAGDAIFFLPGVFLVTGL